MFAKKTGSYDFAMQTAIIDGLPFFRVASPPDSAENADHKIGGPRYPALRRWSQTRNKAGPGPWDP